MNREASIKLLCQLGLYRFLAERIVDLAIQETNNEFSIRGIKTYFSESFDKYSTFQKRKILKTLLDKYEDWDDIVERNYDTMYSRFTESYRSKLYSVMTDPEFELRYPEKTDKGLRFVVILSAAGKNDNRYFLSMGKFTIKV
jgi:hypothetical protein